MEWATGLILEEEEEEEEEDDDNEHYLWLISLYWNRKTFFKYDIKRNVLATDFLLLKICVVTMNSQCEPDSAYYTKIQL
jgi:hypothetical protein